MNIPFPTPQPETLPVLPDQQRLSNAEAFFLLTADLQRIGQLPLNKMILWDGETIEIPLSRPIETEVGVVDLTLRPELVRVLLVAFLIWVSWLRSLKQESLLIEVDKIALGKLPAFLVRIIRLLIGDTLKTCPGLAAARRADSAVVILDDWRGNLDFIQTMAHYELVSHGEIYEMIATDKDGTETIEAISFPGRILGAIAEKILSAAAAIAEAKMDVIATRLGLSFFSGKYDLELTDTVLTGVVASLKYSGGMPDEKIQAIDSRPSYKSVVDKALHEAFGRPELTGDGKE